MKTKINIILALCAICFLSGCYVCEPGHRAVKVTLGTLDQNVITEGWGFYNPLITDVLKFSMKQTTKQTKTACFSSDLQQVSIVVDILYAINESTFVELYVKYQGDPYNNLILPRLNEVIKEVTSQYTAEKMVKARDEIKIKTLAGVQQKVGNLLQIRDIAINNIDLSEMLEKSIEDKMVQEQEAAKSKFVQDKARIEADTAVIRATGEATAIEIQGKALKDNPHLIQLKIVEKWNGISPLVVGGGEGANILLPITTGTKF